MWGNNRYQYLTEIMRRLEPGFSGAEINCATCRSWMPSAVSLVGIGKSDPSAARVAIHAAYGAGGAHVHGSTQRPWRDRTSVTGRGNPYDSQPPLRVGL